MNQSPVYEQLIAQKLQQLPVPDMADAIWARIEIQLDTDMPSNDKPDPPSTPPTPFPRIKRGAAWLTAVILVVAIIVINKKHRQEKAALQSPAPVNIEQKQSPPLINKPDDAPAAAGASKTTPGAVHTPGIVDSATKADAVPIAIVPAAIADKKDSVNTPVVSLPQLIPAPAVKDSIPRKRRGAQGITDKDYRIVPVPKEGKP